MSDEKTIPHNLPMEMAIIGAVIVDNGAWTRAAEKLSAEDFYSPVCRKIWEAMSRDLLAGRSVSAVSLQSAFEGDVEIREAGGAQLWVKLYDVASMGPETGDFANTVRELAIRRRMLQAAWDLAKAARDMAPSRRLNAPALLQAAQEQIAGVAVTVSADSWQDSRMATVTAMTEAVSGTTQAGLQTGLTPLDQKTGGLYRGDLIVLGGRPSMGKSALADQIEQNVALQMSPDPATGCEGPLADEAGRRRVVAKFSLEMDHRQLAYRNASRMVHARTGEVIAYEKARQGHLSRGQLAAIQAAMPHLPMIHWDTTPRISLHHMRAQLRRLQKRYGRIDMVTTDYLQIMDQQREKGQTDASAISALTAGLKAIAREFDCPVLALSQLSRKVEEREDKRPQMADLRDSGSIEQDADLVIFAYRKFYYLSRAPEPKEATKAAQHEAELSGCEPCLTAIIAKQRMGPIGDANLFWSAETSFIASTREEITGTPGDGRGGPQQPLFEEAYP